MSAVDGDAVGGHDVFDLGGDHAAGSLDAQHVLIREEEDGGGGGGIME